MRTPTRAAMRMMVRLAALIAPLSAPSIASAAGSMEPTPDRLVLQPKTPNGATCQDIAANPEIVLHPPFPAGASPNTYACRPDNVAFRSLMSELGFAIAPTAMHPARTTGFGGFAITLEASYTHINADDVSRASDGTTRQYWHDGTRGADLPNTNRTSIVNSSPDSLIGIYTLKARKGLPLGFEITGALGYVSSTSLWVGGADVRWAILEGFRKGPMGYIPDISIGTGVRTLTGSSKIFLTAVGIDAQVSKPIALADSAVITPYLGYQRLLIYGNSTVVDATPNTDAVRQCGYQGTNPTDGSPVCANSLSNHSSNNGDFNNNVTFEAVRTQRHRGIVGVNYRFEVVYLAAQLIFDITAPDAENPGLSSTRQTTTSLEAGVFF